MKYIEHNDENAVIMLAHAFSNNSLIPIIGAGFTAGCLTRKSTRVPNGREFKDIMINKICSIKCYSDEQNLKKNDLVRSVIYFLMTRGQIRKLDN